MLFTCFDFTEFFDQQTSLTAQVTGCELAVRVVLQEYIFIRNKISTPSWGSSDLPHLGNNPLTFKVFHIIMLAT